MEKNEVVWPRYERSSERKQSSTGLRFRSHTSRFAESEVLGGVGFLRTLGVGVGFFI